MAVAPPTPKTERPLARDEHIGAIRCAIDAIRFVRCLEMRPTSRAMEGGPEP